MAFKTMYAAVAGSPATTTGNTFVAGTTAELTVSQGSVLASAPNLATITAADGRFVTLSYTSKSGNTISGLTALEGDKTGTFAIGSTIARRYSAVDDSAIKDNIADLIDSAPQTKPYNMYVSPSGSDTMGDGTQEKPWRTVQKAIDTIQSLNLPLIPYTINIPSGEYEFTKKEISVTRDVKFAINGNVVFNLKLQAAYAYLLSFENAKLVIVGTNSTDTLQLIYTGGGTTSEEYSLMFRQGSLYISNINVINKYKNGIYFQRARLNPRPVMASNAMIITNGGKFTAEEGTIGMQYGILQSSGDITYDGGTNHRVLKLEYGSIGVIKNITGSYLLDSDSVLSIGGKWVNQS